MADEAVSGREQERAICPPPAPDAWESRLGADEAWSARVQVTPDLVTRWTRRLLGEWRTLNHWRLRGSMKAPQLQITRDMRRWGWWDPNRRLLSISERQIACYTWASVVETLKHEMAHQYVTEVLRVADERPHGAAFRRACRLLGADPAPSGGGGTPLGAHEEPPEPLDPALRRIRKLLALADSNPSEAEAQLAYRRANSMLLKYNLSVADLEAERTHTFRRLGAPSARVPSVAYGVGTILRDYFFVDVLWVHDYVAAEDREGRILEVMGTPANVDMADHVHGTLHRVLDDLWRRHAGRSGARGLKAKRQYQEGVLHGFADTLRSGREEDREEGLVWIGDPRLQAWARTRWPHRRAISLTGVLRTDDHAAGVADGRTVRIHKPVSTGAGAGGRLLRGRS